MMSAAQSLKDAISSAQANDSFTEAVLRLSDESRLCFCHRVDERWAKAVGPEGAETEHGIAGEILAQIQLFRLNSKHLDVLFADGSRWDEPLR
jgi:hypothetical protein